MVSANHMAPKIWQHAIRLALIVWPQKYDNNVHKGISCNVCLQHVSAVIHFHGKLNLGPLKSFPEEVSDRDEVRWK